MFDITLFLTLSALALIGLTITSITLHHLRLDIDQWGDKVLKTVLIFTLPILTLFKPKPQHFRQIFHILSGPPSSLMDQALAVCLATSSTGIFLFLAQTNYRSLLYSTAGICCPVAVLSSVWLVVLGQVFSSAL